MKTHRTAFAAGALALAALALPTPSQAELFDWAMTAADGDWNTPATTWRYDVTSADPGNGNGCAGSPDKWRSSGYMIVFRLGPPYWGSSVRSRWVTLCKDGNYITFELIISVNNCAFWVCDTSWTNRTTRVHNVSYEVKHAGGSVFGPFTHELQVLLNPK